MSMMNLDAAGGAIIGAFKGAGAVVAIGTIYVAVGLPVPASVGYVNSKVDLVVASVADLKTTVLEGELRDIAMKRANLKTERDALARSVVNAPESEKAALNMRLSDIDDELSGLATTGTEIRGKLEHGAK